MDTKRAEIVDFWSRRQDECGLSVDWTEAHKLCWRCAQRRKLQCCHIVPDVLGGSDEPCNLVLLCAQCHAEAPNVADPAFMWPWLRAHAVAFYGTYWYTRGIHEYEFIYGEKPFVGVQDAASLLPRVCVAVHKYVKQTSRHWGQGMPNPATIAWLIRQVEMEAREAT